MHRRETRVLLRHYLEQGVSKTELAKRFGISRRTVYHWIETGQLDRDLDNQQVRYRPRPPVVTRLDPYKPIIQARLEAFPLPTAQRLFEELRSAGYPGGYSQLRGYVRQVRPHAPAEPVVRFETPPGYQGLAPAPAGRIGREPRARWSGRFGTCGRPSSMAAVS
jgi:transposase